MSDSSFSVGFRAQCFGMWNSLKPFACLAHPREPRRDSYKHDMTVRTMMWQLQEMHLSQCSPLKLTWTCSHLPSTSRWDTFLKSDLCHRPHQTQFSVGPKNLPCPRPHSYLGSKCVEINRQISDPWSCFSKHSPSILVYLMFDRVKCISNSLWHWVGVYLGICVNSIIVIFIGHLQDVWPWLDAEDPSAKTPAQPSPPWRSQSPAQSSQAPGTWGEPDRSPTLKGQPPDPGFSSVKCSGPKGNEMIQPEKMLASPTLGT